MCSVGDDNFDEPENSKYMVTKCASKISSKLCNKCKTKKPKILLQHKHGYCKECFLAATTHKFRSYLGSLKLSHTNENVVVVHIAGHSSTALLHLLRTGLDESQHKKLKIHPVILCIDDLYYLSPIERKETLKKIADEARNFNFDVHFASLNRYLITNKIELIENYQDIEMNDDDKSVINTILKENPSKTVLKEITELYKKKLITDAAKILNCKIILSPYVSFHYASSILTDICLGRGANEILNSKVNINTTKNFYDVKILTPFMDLDIKELAFYNYYNNITPISYKIQPQNNYSCVQDLMKKFVADLQVSYPSTITTIVKTGEKLTSNKLENPKFCMFCKGFKQENNGELCSGESTKFSHWVSTKVNDLNPTIPEHYKNLYESFQLNSENNDFCYRCNDIMKYTCK